MGVYGDFDDEHVIPGPQLTIYHPFEQLMFGGELFVRTSANPYGLVAPITRMIHDMSADQPVEHAATLSDVRSEVLTADRLNSIVFGGFAIVALAIAVVGVAGVLAFSVSARTREFGIRLAIGSQPSRLLAGVIAQGAVMAAVGVVTGTVVWVRVSASGEQIFRRHANAEHTASGSLGACAVGRRGRRFGAAGSPRRTRGRHTGPAVGLVS